MDFIIENVNEDISDFCNYLISYIQDILPDMIDDNKLERFNWYFNNILTFNSENRQVSAKDILIASTYCLQYLRVENKYIIKLNEAIKIPNSNYTYSTIIRLINYGNASLAAYPIYDKVMSLIADTYWSLYEQYLREE